MHPRLLGDQLNIRVNVKVCTLVLLARGCSLSRVALRPRSHLPLYAQHPTTIQT